MIRITKDPQAVKDYVFDWSSWLPTGDTIISQTVTPDAGLTVNSSSITTGSTGIAATAVTAWLAGGTLGVAYNVVCHVTTAAGRQDDFTVSVTIADQ